MKSNEGMPPRSAGTPAPSAPRIPRATSTPRTAEPRATDSKRSAKNAAAPSPSPRTSATASHNTHNATTAKYTGRKPAVRGHKKRPRKTGKDPFKTRLTLSIVTILLVALVMLGRLAYIQIGQASRLRAEAGQSKTVSGVLFARRGSIIDSSGKAMAISTDKYRITAAPRNIQSFVPIDCTAKTKNYCHSVDGKPVNAKGAVAVARIISPLLELNPLELGAKLNGDGLYVEVKKDVSIETKRKIDKLNLAGYIFSEVEPDRAYPNGNVAGNIIGAVSTDNKGSAGIEQMEEKVLSGTPGKYSYEIGAEGQEIPQTDSKVVEPIPGKTVQSTIDLDVQWKVQQALDEGAKAEYGIAVVEDVKTGAILALADTNSPAAGTPEVAFSPSRAVTDVFEPGSTAKVITCSELIDLGLQTPFSQFQVPYSWTTGGQAFSDAEGHGVENLTLTGILAHSSNVGTLMASSALSNEQKWDYLSRFGVGKLTGIGLPGESAGLMAPWQSWDGRTQYTVLFGQGLATNAIQATNVFAAIANKGKKLTPTIIKGVIDSNGKVSGNTRPAPEQVIRPETADQVMKMMEAAITDGNIYGVNVPGYRVAGKTGTAQMANSNGKLTDIMASFIGVFPADNPKYVVSVFYKNPQGDYFGALVAGPVATKIMNFLVSHESITPSKPIEDPFPTGW